jgi:outer membrane receptor protein involved in Fe transport
VGPARRARHGRLALAAAAVIASSSLLLAQTTGFIEGTVADPNGAPLPGATVELSSPRMQGTRTVETSTSGVFRFPGVPPGSYTVTAALPGFATVRKTATVSLDATATVVFQLSVAASAEVLVSGQAPLVDAVSTTTGTSYTARTIDRLPVGRNYADIVFAQPGAQADFGETKGRSLAISLYGSTSAENLYLIDGVNTTSVLRGIEGKDINAEFVDDVEVKTGGYQAEYGRNTGGVINVITKSGGNEFHGGVFGYYNDTGMRATPANAEAANYTTPDFSETGDAQAFNYVYSKDVRQEYGVDLGGFVWKDRVWFFGAFDRVQIDQNIRPLDITNTETLGRDFPNAYVQNKYAAKLTLNIMSGTSVVGSYFSDAQTQLGVLEPPPSSLEATSYAGRRDTGGPDYSARLNQLLGSLGLFTFQYARHSDRNLTIPDGADIPAIRDFTVDPNDPSYSVKTGGFGQVFSYLGDNHSAREAFAGSATAYVGNMELKAGGDYSRDATFGTTYLSGGTLLRIRPCLNATENPGDPSFCDLTKAKINTNPAGRPVPVYYDHRLLVQGTQDNYRVVPSADSTAIVKRAGAFLQDQWRVSPRVTVNAGLRFDTESYYGFDPQSGPFKAFSLKNQWAPRLGFIWDFAGDGTAKLYGSVGRFYYALPTVLTTRSFTAASELSVFNYDPNSLDPDPTAPQTPLFQGGDPYSERFDPGTGQSYQDEATIGVEKAFTPSLSVGLKATYRALGRAVEDRCDLNADTSVDENGNRVCPACAPSTCAIFNAGGSGPAASGYYPTCDGSGVPSDPAAGTCSTQAGVGTPIGPARRYFRGVELMARERLSDELWAQASFLYSSLMGNYSGAVREASGQTDPGINSDFDYAQFMNRAYGRLELDRPVQARLDAFYDSRFGLSAGVSFYIRSGRPTSRLGWYNGFYVADLNLVTRGSDGRLPTDYDMNVSLSYDLNVGPLTITPLFYVSSLLNRQTPNDVLQLFNSSGAFVSNSDSPFNQQPGVEPGQGSCPATATAPCSDSPDYRKVTQRISPRFLRVALRITF